MILPYRILQHLQRSLISDRDGFVTGEDLLKLASAIAVNFPEQIPPGSVISLLSRPGRNYVAGMLAGWMRGMAVVPLCPDHPAAEMDHAIRDSASLFILAEDEIKDRLPQTSSIPVFSFPAQTENDFILSLKIDPQSDALILYTSGTTGKPKGAVHTHAGLEAQITCLVQAWEWTEDDAILHFLPLHHTHGIVNKLFCALYAGARCDFMDGFDAALVWDKLLRGNYSLFMAVPSVYSRLIGAWENADEIQKQKLSEACGRLRLMVCGSAALPVPVLEKWKNISGHILLERYGMTEIGMALSNPLHGLRMPGFVGLPLPGVEVRIVDETDRETESGTPGELQVKGKNLFSRYLNLPEITASSFSGEWFRTGDLAVFENGAYRILGRISADIIKTGGYKVSAIEIENVLLVHPAIAEIAITGTEDENWGERVSAVIVLRAGYSLDIAELRSWCREKLAVYKIPSQLHIASSLPRNQMGKVLKKELKQFFGS